MYDLYCILTFTEHVWQNVILVVFIDTSDDEQETFNLIEVKSFLFYRVKQ